LGDNGIDGRIMLEWILRIVYRLDSSGSRYRPLLGSCWHGNERPDSIRGGEFRDQLSDYLLLKKNSVPLNYVRMCVHVYVCVYVRIMMNFTACILHLILLG